MTRYQKLFSKLNSYQTGAFIPFITLGDPNFNQSIKIINTLIKSGADALELGVPFSDPLADGVSIQNSFQRALNAKITIIDSFKIIKIIRQQHPNIPIGLLTYTNIVYKNGINAFYSYCLQSEIDSILIADLPIEESKIFRNTASDYSINQVFICPPNANTNLLKKIAKYSQGYVYLISRLGVTGNEGTIHHHSLNNLIENLKTYQSCPIIQGFGISSPSVVKKSLLSGISGVISGSAIADIIQNNIHCTHTLLKQINNFVISMKNATFK